MWPRRHRGFRFAIAFESALGLVAIAVARWLGFSAWKGMDAFPGPADLRAVGWGLLGAVPLIASLWLTEWLDLSALRRLQRQAQRLARRLFGGLGWPRLLAVALAAGVGEELLFRGLLQSGLSAWWGGPYGQALALVVSSAAFGACHALSRSYAAAAAIAGLYLGGLLLATEHVLVPITTHAAYDFVALVYLLRRPPAGFRKPLVG